MAEIEINTHFSTEFYAQLNIPPFPIHDGVPTLRRYLFHFARIQLIYNLNYQSIALAIPVLITFLQLKYPGNADHTNSPFATRPATMHVAVSSSVIFYFACILHYRFPAVSFKCSVLFGFISVASLASVLLPDSFSPLVYAVFALMAASDVLYCLWIKLVAEFELRRWRICRVLKDIWLWRNMRGLIQLQQILPL